MAYNANSTATPPMLPGQRPGQLTSADANEGHHPPDAVYFPKCDLNQNTVGEAINRIEDILHAVREDLFNDHELAIPYRSRRATHDRDDVHPATVLRFPGRTQHEANKFARVMRILGLSRGALIAGVVLTKRNLFYQDVELFGSQAVVDRLVDDIAYTLKLGRHDLNIVAAGKGLVSGPILMNLASGVQIDGVSDPSGVLIPFAKDLISINFASSRWVLVIEKEATFRSLTDAQYWNRSKAGCGILVTGKGYPDLVTRSFLHVIQALKPEMPVYSLVDFDPDGLRIMRCYKHGSLSLSHEENIKLPRLQWLGIKSGDLGTEGRRRYDVARQELAGTFQQSLPAADPSVLIPLSARDRRCGQKVLASIDGDSEDVDEMECRRELQIMLYLGIKAEMQAVDAMGDMADWLDEKLVDAAGEWIQSN